MNMFRMNTLVEGWDVTETRIGMTANVARFIAQIQMKFTLIAHIYYRHIPTTAS